MADRMRARRANDGFTLIELLIVIVILGILAAIVVFAVGTTGKNSAAAACNADAKSVETALEAYKAQNNSDYPATLTSQDATGSGSWAPLLDGSGADGAPYLRSVPGTDHYTIWFDSDGKVWIGAKGLSSPPSYSAATDFDKAPDACKNKAT